MTSESFYECLGGQSWSPRFDGETVPCRCPRSDSSFWTQLHLTFTHLATIFSYPRQQSVMTVKSLLTWRSMMSSRVSASRLFSGHTAKNTSFVSLRIPPTTYWPSTNLPLLYFLFPNLLSSISTVSPGPPINVGVCLAMISKHTSRQ